MALPKGDSRLNQQEVLMEMIPGLTPGARTSRSLSVWYDAQDAPEGLHIHIPVANSPGAEVRVNVADLLAAIGREMNERAMAVVNVDPR